MDYQELALASIAAIPTVVASVLGFLTAHKVVSKRNSAKVYRYAATAASAAEEVFSNELVSGEIKRQWVSRHIEKKFGLSEREAEVYLNAAVDALRATGQKEPRQKGSNVVEMTEVPPPAA